MSGLMAFGPTVGIPIVRGDCGGVWLCWYPSKCRGDCGGCEIGFVVTPLSEEVIVGELALRLIPPV